MPKKRWKSCKNPDFSSIFAQKTPAPLKSETIRTKKRAARICYTFLFSDNSFNLMICVNFICKQFRLFCTDTEHRRLTWRRRRPLLDDAFKFGLFVRGQRYVFRGVPSSRIFSYYLRETTGFPCGLGWSQNHGRDELCSPANYRK